MDSRKRFKSEISDKYVKEMFDKGRRKRKQKAIVESDKPSIKSVTSVPSSYLASHKQSLVPRKRDIAKPENWVMPKESKPSRSEILKAEKDNIKSRLNEEQSWRRAAKNLNMAINEPQSSSSCRPYIPDEHDDGDKSSPRSNQPDRDSTRLVRKNHSKEFLQTFFKRASLIAAEKEVTRKC